MSLRRDKKAEVYSNLTSQTNHSMVSKKQIIIVLAVLIILLVAACLGLTKKKVPPAASPEVTPPIATGDIAKAIDSFILDADNESLNVKADLDETPLITVDAQAVGSFGQLYDENEF